MARRKAPGPIYARNLDVCGAIYVRVSKNDLHDGHGTNAQKKRLEAIAKKDGVPIRYVFTDDGVSAWKVNGKRPGFLQLLSVIPTITHLYAWHTDRLIRQNAQVEMLIDLLDRYEIPVCTYVAGRIDATTAGGRKQLRDQAQAAQYESDVKSERVRLAQGEILDAGLPSSGKRAYGYFGADVKLDRKANMVIDPAEKVIIREMVDRILKGETTNAIAKSLNGRCIPTAKGKLWTSTTIRDMLISNRLVGIREHHVTNRHGEPTGEVILKPAAWLPIITPEEHAMMRALFVDGVVTGNRGKPRRLLSGIARCAECGGSLTSKVKGTAANPDRHVYYCQPAVGRVNCGKVLIDGPGLEALVDKFVWEFVDGNALAGAESAPSEHDAIVEQLRALDEREAVYADKAAAGEIDDDFAAKVVKKIKADRVVLNARLGEQLVETRRVDMLDWDTARSGWASMPVETKRPYIEAAVGPFYVARPLPGMRTDVESRFVPAAKSDLAAIA